LGFLAQIYKEKLIDPIDKPPNLAKTVNRIIETIHLYFSVIQFQEDLITQ